MRSMELAWPRAAFCLLMLSGPIAVFAQPDPERTAAIEQQIRENIATAQAQHGASSEALIPLYTELGHFYRELGHEEQAAAAFMAARGVVRMNRGLSSLDEAPMLEELISIEEDLGYAEDAWKRQHDLLALANAHQHDLRAAAIYQGLGDKRLDLLSRYLSGEFPPQLVWGCYYNRSRSVSLWDLSADGSCTAGSRSQLIGAVTTEALAYYSAAIKTLLDHKQYWSPELIDLEMRIVRSSYALGAYSFGRRSLVRLLTYDVARDESLLTRVDSLLKIADWDIVTTQKTGTRNVWSSALDTYEQAYAKLVGEGIDPASIEALFAPNVPVMLPAFAPNPLASRSAADTAGHIDVAFEVTKYGRARRSQILDSNAPREAERELLREIVRGVFRPRVIDGHVADAAPVMLRYYVTPGLP